MHIFLEVLRCLIAGFFAAWAVSMNELRYKDKVFTGKLLWLYVILLFAIAFGVAIIHV